MAETDQRYVPEVGQMFFGAPWSEFKVPEFVVALYLHIEREIERVYRNYNQRQWDHHTDPGFDGIEWRPYYWGDHVGDDGSFAWGHNEQNLTECPCRLPNFEFEDVQIRWYKNPHRGMTSNVTKTEAEWAGWMDRCLKTICAYDVPSAAKEAAKWFRERQPEWDRNRATPPQDEG